MFSFLDRFLAGVIRRTRILPLLLAVMGVSSLAAAQLSYQTADPALGGNDIGNFTGATRDRENIGGNGTSDGTANDSMTYVANDRPQQGQTFTTGTSSSSYQINAVWLRHVGYSSNTVSTFWRTQNGNTMTVRITNPSAAGAAGFVLASETVTTTGAEPGTPNSLAPVTASTSSNNGTGVWVRFGFSTPIIVQPNTVYGFDVTSGSGTFFFETLGNRTSVYSGGAAYTGSTNGVADNTMNALTGDRVFVVESDSAPYSEPLVQAKAFPLNRVRLLDSRFKSNQDLLRTGYLAWIDPDRLLYQFRFIAGLPQVNGATHLGGWEGGSGFTAVRGHMLGHYLSASSKMYAATGDASYLAKIQYLVTELKKCQDAIGTQEVAAGRVYGYLSGFPVSYFDVLETNPTSAQVPFYTIHKIMAGLVDAYREAGVNQALDIAISMSDYHRWRVNRLTAAQIEAMFRTDNGNTEEWGGMNETLTDIYLLSRARGDANPERHLSFAKIFHRDWFITPLFNNLDQLNGLHANTHIPQVVGFAHTASVLNTADSQRDRLYKAADNFWHIVNTSHWLILGGNSYGEHFSTPGKETGINGSALRWDTAETCNTYNMLKLTGELFQHDPKVEYADYYEHALYNHILASLAPDTGMATYFVSMEPGHFKTYGKPEGSCWCCTGSGLENPAVYNQYIYFHSADTLWINLFIPSTLNWSEKGLNVRMETAFPNSDNVQATLSCAQPTQAKIRLRIPSWINATPTLSVNGTNQNVTAVAGYIELDRTWADGDVISLTVPMGLRLDRSMDDPNEVSILYGPILLAGNLGTSGMPVSDQANDQWDLSTVDRVPVPILVAPDASSFGQWVQPGGQPLTFNASSAFAGDVERSSISLQPFYDVHHTRYSAYWKLIAPAGLRTWSGGGAQPTWSTAGNWDALPAATYALRFAAAAGGTPSNNFTAGTQFNGIEFPSGAGAFVLGGNRVGLQGDIRNSSFLTQRIDLPLELRDGISWQFDAAGADLVLGGPITGSGILNKRGAHSLALLGDSGFSGSVRVSEGALQVGDGGTTGSLGSTPVSLANGTDLVFNRSDTFDVLAPVSGFGRLIKRGAGTMRLAVPSTQMGPVIVEEGALGLGSQQVQLLAHRWSFNGSLSDSAGSANAVIVDVGANNATLSSTAVTLAGGTKATSDYVSLGSGLLPKDGRPLTIEVWGTQLGLQNWSRIFDVGVSTTENLFMSWSQDSLATDRFEWKDGSTVTVNSSVAPYTVGTEFHLVLMIEPGAGSGGTTRVTWYAAPASAAGLGSAKGSFNTTNTPADLTDTNFWLGRSEYGDPVAHASYNEIRLWTRTFTAAELAELHNLGPDSVGTYATLTINGSLAAATDLSLGASAEFDAGGNTQEVSSLSGGAGSTLRLAGGQLKIRGGGNAAATFAGTFAGTGTILNNGTLRLVGNAVLPAGIDLVNNGVLDIMSWQGSLPSGFVNNGTVLDHNAVRVKTMAIEQPDAKITIQGYSGHTYQLQFREELTSGSWTDIGEPVAGADAPIIFTHAGGATGLQRFYRIVAGP